MSKEMKIKIIGAGGIGSHLVLPLSRYVASLNVPVSITIIDGDEVKEHNLFNQNFRIIGVNKAEALKNSIPKELHRKEISIWAVKEYLTPKNISKYISNGDIVFLCVDNHFTRKFVNRYCITLNNIVLFSSGCGLTDGTARMLFKLDSGFQTTDLEYLDSAIGKATAVELMEKLEQRAEADCEEVAQTNPQLIWANMQCATLLGEMFYQFMQEAGTVVAGAFKLYGTQSPIIYFDLSNGQKRVISGHFNDAVMNWEKHLERIRTEPL